MNEKLELIKKINNELYNLNENQLKELEKRIEEIKNPPITEKKKRSLNANSYMWILLQKLADVHNTSKEEIYRKYIKEKGIFRTMTVSNDALNTLTKIWCDKGLGWIYEITNKGNMFTDLNLYYGTSVYNTKQMSNLVNYIVEDCKESGIETMTPNELNELLSKWGAVE